MKRRAVFLDRDGVLVRDVDFLVRAEDIRVLAGVPAALRRLRGAGYLLIGVSNQAAVARGMLVEAEVWAIQREVERVIGEQGGERLDGFYFCPHHPNATLENYREACGCRKPRPGLLLAAGRDHGIDLGGSVMVGDRMTDVMAGAAAGCRTVLVETGKHAATLIETAGGVDRSIRPNFTCGGLAEAAEWILGNA